MKNLFWICLAMGVCASGCDESKEVQKWVKNTSNLRLLALAQVEAVPYREPQHQALKGYFGELVTMGLALRNDVKFTSRFNEGVSKVDLAQVCSQVFVSKAEWGAMMQNCTRNGFFLCAEEVKAYPEEVGALRSRLTPDLQRRFDQIEACRRAL